jgi:hypothetical protein
MDGKARQRPIRAKFAWIRRSRRALFFIFQKKEENGDRSLVASLEFWGLFFFSHWVWVFVSIYPFI